MTNIKSLLKPIGGFQFDIGRKQSGGLYFQVVNRSKGFAETPELNETLLSVRYFKADRIPKNIHDRVSQILLLLSISDHEEILNEVLTLQEQGGAR
jgi:hypothetical protein